MLSNTEPARQWRPPVGLAGQPPSDHIPTMTMLDYAYGGLDDEHLEALFGTHLRVCASCARGRDVYRAQRPADPALISTIPEFSLWPPVEDTYKLSPEEAGQRLRDFVATTTGPLTIVAGEANPEVYDPALGDVIRERSSRARRQGETIPRVLCGPAMGLDKKIPTSRDAILPLLAEEGHIQLYAAQTRQRLHFRVAGSDRVYTERYHEAGNRGDRQGFWYQSAPIAGLLTRRFEATLRANIGRPAVREDFVYIKMSTIREIQGSVNFDRLTAEQLARYAD